MGVLLASTDTHADISGSDAAELLSYRNSSSDPKTIIARIEISDIVGFGDYYPINYINNVPDSPIFPLSLTNQQSFTVQVGPTILVAGDTMSIRLRGVIGDTNVHCKAYIIDANGNTNLSDIDISRITTAVIESLGHVTIAPERTILAPIPKCVGETRIILAPIPQTVKTFILPK